MDSRKKILLGIKDVVPKLNEDNYIFIDLQRNYREVWPNRYYNDFDVFDQFAKERNDSRDFIFYGIVDSNKEDADNIPYSIWFLNASGQTVYKKTRPTPTSNTYETYQLSDDEFGGYRNIFGFKRGQYKFELSREEFYQYSSMTTAMILFSGSSTPVNAFKRQFVYYEDFLNIDGYYEKKPIAYGTRTVETNADGSLFEVNNDFPFFYGKHWIKTNFNIQSKISLSETEMPYISVGIDAGGVLASEFTNLVGTTATDVIYSLDLGQTYDIIINLNGSTAVGNEEVILDVEIIDDSSLANIHPSPFTPGSTFENFPMTVRFNAGETEKRIPINIQDNFGMVYSVAVARINISGVTNCLISPYNQVNTNVIRIAENPIITMVGEGSYIDQSNWRIYTVVKGETINFALDISEPAIGDEEILIYEYGMSNTTTYDTSNSEFDGFNPYTVSWSLGESGSKFVPYQVPVEFGLSEEIEYLFFDLSGATNCQISTFNLANRIAVKPRNKKIDLSFYNETVLQDGNEYYIEKSPGDQIQLVLTLELPPHGQEQVQVVNEGISEDGSSIPAFQFPTLNPTTFFWGGGTNASQDIIIPYIVPGDSDLLNIPLSPMTKINFVLEDFGGGTGIGDYNNGHTLSIRLT